MPLARPLVNHRILQWLRPGEEIGGRVSGGMKRLNAFRIGKFHGRIQWVEWNQMTRLAYDISILSVCGSHYGEEMSFNGSHLRPLVDVKLRGSFNQTSTCQSTAAAETECGPIAGRQGG